MKPFKVMTVVGTRPEIIRLSRVLAKLDQYTDHILVHTGQNSDFELNEIFFQQLGIRKPKYFLNAAGKTPAETMGKVITSVDPVLEAELPDALLVLGDTNSCLAALSAKRRRVPVFHMEAGNRCFDMRVPEEINRRIIDHVSDINLTYSEHARRYLLREGFPPERVIKTGSPMFEVLTHYRPQVDASQVLKEMNLKANSYFVVSCHREENVDTSNNLSKLLTCLNSLIETYDKDIVFSVHPRTRKRLEALNKALNPSILLHKPFGLFDYLHLQMQSFCVLSDSGTISEESSILNFPALNIREAHERPEGMDEGAVMMTGLNLDRIMQALKVVLDQKRGNVERTIRPVVDYSNPNVSDKVVRIMISYRDYVKRWVWSEQLSDDGASTQG
jgi:UDP-N-acetylglucosamine 2-epimerase (non-hydrolysing)